MYMRKLRLRKVRSLAQGERQSDDLNECVAVWPCGSPPGGSPALPRTSHISLLGRAFCLILPCWHGSPRMSPRLWILCT